MWLLDPYEPRRMGPGLVAEFTYRYIGMDGLAHTLAGQRLRLNAWSQMNDPRETKEWSPTGPIKGAGSLTDHEVQTRIDNVLRRSARLLSLSQDREPESETSRPYLFHRGWARAAMWDRYAAKHRGACLLLDTSEVTAMTGRIPAVDGRYTIWGKVKYADLPIEIPISGTFQTMDEVNAAIEDFTDKRWSISGLHMTKNLDWQYETEVRLAFIDLKLPDHELDTPIYVPVGTALKAVILGEQYPAPDLLAHGARALLGTTAPEFFRCSWVGGSPSLLRIP
jgi:hypothetical protein